MARHLIDYKGIILEVQGEYQKAEKRTHEYPGFDNGFDIDKVFYKDIDITELLKVINFEFIEFEQKILDMCY